MPWIATAEECRQMDREAEKMGITVEQLMREAGRAVAACVLEHFPEAKRIAVVCGKGNNGGDGLVAAKLLAEHQRKVNVLIAGSPEDLNENARRECERLKEVGLQPKFLVKGDWSKDEPGLKRADLVVDALLGTGLKGTLSGDSEAAIDAVMGAEKRILSVDIPSGVECDTGSVAGDAVWASRTITFGLPKPFLFQGLGMIRSGEWSVAPIGFPAELLEAPRSARLIDPPRLPTRFLSAHKGTEGHVLIVAGQERMPGAAVLAALGALRAGAGLVTVVSVPVVCAAVASHIPEAILLPLKSSSGALDAHALPELRGAVEKSDSVVFGPGLGQSEGTGDLLEQLWRALDKPCVIDADALNLAAEGIELPRSENVVLTPHPGEAGRLLGSDAARVQENRFASARALAEKFGKTILLKGAYTLVSRPSKCLLVNPTGNPGMASPGMGDVLSGVIGTLLAQGLSPSDAAASGAYWHGLAGDICAREIGPVGFLASDVADALPRAKPEILKGESTTEGH